MKKILIVFIASIFIVQAGKAQNLGGGLALGTENNIGLGIGAVAQFPISNPELVIAPSFIVFFPDDHAAELHGLAPHR